MDKERLGEKKAEIDAMELKEREMYFYGAIEMDDEPEILNLYLERGVSVDFRTPSGNTALTEAASNSNIEHVKFLLSKGADVNAVDSNQYIALRYAALFGDHEIAKLLIDAGANIEYIDDEELSILFTALKRAVKQPENSIVVKHLIDAGVNINPKSWETPLYKACKVKSYEICKLLIEAGADVNGLGENELSPLSAAVFNPKNVELLLKHGATITYNGARSPLEEAAGLGAVDSMKHLIDAGGDINNTSAKNPFVFSAVRWNKVEMVEYLIEKGVDLTLTGENGKTIQEYVNDKTDPKIVELLSNK